MLSDSNEKLVYDLSKKYVFETFDFKNQPPEDLLKAFQDVHSKLSDIIYEQESLKVNESLKDFGF